MHYRALSVADAEALVIARADNAVLLTGDGSLRKAALDSGCGMRSGRAPWADASECHPRGEIVILAGPGGCG